MKIGIIGSGAVGEALGTGFAELGHTVRIGTRNPAKLGQWLQQVGDKASIGGFEDAARYGELIVLATKWADSATENAIGLAGKENFAGKIVIDVTNPLQFDMPGQPPKPALGFPKSGGAQVQSWLPQSKVVKAFNIVTANYMTSAKLKQGTPDLFIAGNDSDAKKVVAGFASNWGWEVTDIGDIDQAYLLEALALLWIRYGMLHNHWKHAFKLLKE
jgi:predicted dinucleotide-binding enzyme